MGGVVGVGGGGGPVGVELCVWGGGGGHRWRDCSVVKSTGFSSRGPGFGLWHSPGRLIEGNCANMELLDLIDGANGESAVIGQCQTK